MKGLDTLKWFGLGLAATLLLFFAGLRVPIFGLAALPLVIYPALFVGVRVGKQTGQLLPAAAVACLYVMAGLEAAAAYLVLALVTFLMFLSFGRGWSIARVVSGSAICTVAVMLATAAAFAGSLSTLWTTLQAGVQAQVLMTLEVYERMGLSGETIDFLREHAGQMAALFVQMLPGMIFLALGSWSWLIWPCCRGSFRSIARFSLRPRTSRNGSHRTTWCGYCWYRVWRSFCPSDGQCARWP